MTRTVLRGLHQDLAGLHKRSAGKPCLLLVGGLSRSGKTTFSRRLVARAISLGLDSLSLSMDHWIVGLESRPPDCTVRERYETAAIYNSIRDLLDGQAVYPPLYDATTRRRVRPRAEKPVYPPANVLVAEGVLALDSESLRNMAWRRIYIQTDRALRRARLRTFYSQKGLSDSQIEKLIETRERDETPIVETTRSHADYVFDL